MKNFRVIKFSRFCSICEIFLTVDDRNTDEILESSWHLVYTTRYQESQGLLGVVFNRTFMGPAECGHVANLFTDHRCIIIFSRVKFLRLVSTAKLF